MAYRACGYCRVAGHRSDRCTVRLNQIEAMRRHVYAEKVALHRILLDNGYGVGAIIQSNGDSPMVIRSLKETFLNHNNIFIEYRNIKYRKSVRSYLKSYSGVNHSPDFVDGDFTRFENMGHLYILASPLDDLSDTNYGIIAISRLDKKPESNPHASVLDSYYSQRSVNLLAPSNETDIDERALFMEPFRIHERLGTVNGRAKIVTPMPPSP